jgi:hypothetical protein
LLTKCKPVSFSRRTLLYKVRKEGRKEGRKEERKKERKKERKELCNFKIM